MIVSNGSWVKHSKLIIAKIKKIVCAKQKLCTTYIVQEAKRLKLNQNIHLVVQLHRNLLEVVVAAIYSFHTVDNYYYTPITTITDVQQQFSRSSERAFIKRYLQLFSRNMISDSQSKYGSKRFCFFFNGLTPKRLNAHSLFCSLTFENLLIW